MRSAFAAALAAATLAAAPARAFQWVASAGGEYRRTDAWSPEGDRARYPSFGIDLALDAGGSLGRPGLFEYAGGVGWHRLQLTQTGGVNETRKQLSYRLRGSLFSDPTSPLGLSANASRVTDDVSAEVVGGGSVTSTTFGADGRITALDRPALTFGYQRTDIEQESRLVGGATSHLQSYFGTLNHGTSAYSVNLGYHGNRGEGTYATQNADEHRVEADVSAALLPTLGLRISDTWFLRRPTATAGLNPRQEMNTFSAQAHYTPLERTSELQAASYTYARAVQEVPGLDRVEQTSQRASYQLQHALDANWLVRGTASGSLVEAARGALSERTSGESLGAVVTWRSGPERALELRAGPTLGLIQPTGEPSRVGWGAQGGVTALRTFGALTAQAGYDVAYRRDLDVRGWGLSQSANAGASGPFGAGTLAGRLMVTSDRAEGGFFGATASRGITGAAGYRYGVSSLDLQLGIQDGLSNALGRSVTGDGLFLPAPYDSHSRYALLSAASRVWRYVGLRARTRYSASEIPDRPSYDELELFAAVDLYYGALRLGVEERFLSTEVPGGRSRSNEVFFRLQRVWGSRL